MRLIGLRIDKNPLTVDFMWKPNRKREEDFICQKLYKNMYFDITDPDKIGKIMDYFVNRCDVHKSPQSLFECKGIDYLTLTKDYEENSDFDEVLDRIIKMLGIYLSDEDRSYISCIDVSYPKTWEVQIL